MQVRVLPGVLLMNAFHTFGSTTGTIAAITALIGAAFASLPLLSAALIFAVVALIVLFIGDYGTS